MMCYKVTYTYYNLVPIRNRLGIEVMKTLGNRKPYVHEGGGWKVEMLIYTNNRVEYHFV